MRLVSGRVNIEVLLQKMTQVSCSIRSLRDNLHAIAGAENQAFTDAGHCHQTLQGLRQFPLRDGKTLPDFDRRRFVIHPEQLQVHGLPS